MGIEATYLDMLVEISDLDIENLEYHKYCAMHRYHLQLCNHCNLLRYPPTTACPWCADPESTWVPVEGKGTVYSYEEVTHAIQPGFKEKLPYLVLLVELDTQKGEPTEHDALRIIGNLTDARGNLAPSEMVEKVGIGTRVRIVFKNITDGLSIPQWTIDEEAEQPNSPWRYSDMI